MKIPRPFIIAFLFIAFIGFVDAIFLAANHYLEAVPPCYIVQGCETVTTSSYSKIFAIPVSLIGSMHYLGLIVLSLFYIDKKKSWTLPVLFVGTSVGFIMSLWFLYVQLFIIKELCMYCLISGFTSSVLFLISLWLYMKRPKNIENVSLQ